MRNANIRHQARLILPSKMWYYLVMRQRQALLRLPEARSNELTMRNNPFNQFRFGDRAVCKTPTERFKFVVRTGKRKTVYLQKNHHGKYADAFVPVKKGMIFNKGKSEMRRHCLNSRVQILTAESMIRRIDRKIEQISVPYAVKRGTFALWARLRYKSAALRDKPAMQRYYFIGVDTLYADQFANALNAAMCLSIIPSPAVITSSGKASVNSTASVSVIGVKVKTTLPVGTSSGTLINRLDGMSTVFVIVIRKI
jgi:hypothetical protein